MPVGGLIPRNGCRNHIREVRSSFPFASDSVIRSENSGSSQRYRKSVCRWTPTSRAASPRAQPSARNCRIDFRFHSSDIALEYLTEPSASIALAPVRGGECNMPFAATVQPLVARSSLKNRSHSDLGTIPDNLLAPSRRNLPCNRPCNRTR